MAGSHIPAATPNKRLYNGGSEWQDDIDGLADYYSTFFREYDAVIGRFNGVDPMSTSNVSLSVYSYAGSNPIKYNDPNGDMAKAQFDEVVNTLLNTENGGSFNSTSNEYSFFSSSDEAFGAGAGYVSEYNMWGTGNGVANSFTEALNSFNGGQITPEMVKGYFTLAWLGKGRSNINVSYAKGVNANKGFNVTWSNTELPNDASETALGSVTIGGKFIPNDYFNELANKAFVLNLIKGLHVGFTLTDVTTIFTVEKSQKYVAGAIYGVHSFSKAKKVLNTARKFEKISRGLGIAAIFLTTIDMAVNPEGPQLHHFIDIAVAGISMGSPVFGIAYGIADISVDASTGKSISEHAQEGIENIPGFVNNVVYSIQLKKK